MSYQAPVGFPELKPKLCWGRLRPNEIFCRIRVSKFWRVTFYYPYFRKGDIYVFKSDFTLSLSKVNLKIPRGYEHTPKIIHRSLYCTRTNKFFYLMFKMQNRGNFSVFLPYLDYRLKNFWSFAFWYKSKHFSTTLRFSKTKIYCHCCRNVRRSLWNHKYLAI